MKIIFSGKEFIPVVIKLQNYTHANVNRYVNLFYRFQCCICRYFGVDAAMSTEMKRFPEFPIM